MAVGQGAGGGIRKAAGAAGRFESIAARSSPTTRPPAPADLALPANGRSWPDSPTTRSGSNATAVPRNRPGAVTYLKSADLTLPGENGGSGLVVRRVLRNKEIADYYGVNPDAVFADAKQQQALLERMLPDQIDAGRNPKTFAWMVNRTTDGSGRPVPRELIHLLSATRESQLRRLEVGHPEPPDEELFDRAGFKEALSVVSEVRLWQTLYAEYSNLQPYLEKLDGEKAEQRSTTLAKIWKVSEEEAVEIAEKLVGVGFFVRPGNRDDPTYWVPFLYRDALNLVQGQARI